MSETVADIVDMEAATALQADLAEVFREKPLSVIALVLMNELANVIILRRPTMEKAHGDVDAMASALRTIVVSKAKHYPEMIDQGEPHGGVE